MDDLISRKDAIQWVQNILATHLYYHPHSKSINVPIDEVIDSLERVPSIDAVPVIRCKDCKHYDKGTIFPCGIAADFIVGDDDYCSSAERSKEWS